MTRLINVTSKAISLINHSVNREAYNFVDKDFLNINIESLMDDTLNVKDNISLLKMRGLIDKEFEPFFLNSPSSLYLNSDAKLIYDNTKQT